ncbi:MAG: type II toxin-antitoxin system VapC family toxin [Anaerolineales bacterium]|jgi:predicted nucleic acid-binding protein
MNYLLDTCVLSEFTRRQPEEKVIHWLESIDEEMFFISVITIGEIQRGVERLAESHRKTELLVWLNNDLIKRFGDRAIPLYVPIMLRWGSLTARMESAGRPIAIMDSLIAATALHNQLVIATRNVTDFLPCGAQVINPWE